MKRPRVLVNCVAQKYADPDQRIVEFSSDCGGGLISMFCKDGELIVELYHLDKTVMVNVENVDLHLSVGEDYE